MKKISVIIFAMLVFIVAMAAVACKSNISIEINKQNKPREVYVLGQDLDLSIGSIVVKDGNNEYTENLSSPEVSVSGYEKDRLGAKELTVSYKGATTSYFVNVYNSIEISGGLVNYFVGEPFDKTKGEITFTDDDGNRTTVTQNDLTVIGYDPNKVGEQEITLQYGAAESKMKVWVWEIDGNASEFIAPDKKSYKSHETEIDLIGGKIKAKNTTGEITKDVELSKATISGFNPAAATSANTASNPLKQTVSVTFAGKTWTFDINVVYTEVTGFKTVAQKYIDRKYDYLKIDPVTKKNKDLTAEEQAEVFAAMDLLLTFGEDERGFITDEEKLAIAVPACFYGQAAYNEVFGEFVPVERADEEKAFSYVRMSTGNGTQQIVLSFNAPTYSIAKNAYDKLMAREDENIVRMLRYNKLVMDTAEDPEFGNLMLPQPVLEFIGRSSPTSLATCFVGMYFAVDLQELLYDGAGTNPGVLSVVKHMLDFYNKFDGIELDNMNQAAIKTRLDDLYDDLITSAEVGGDYNLIAKWTKADKDNPKDIVFILFKHLYDKAEDEGFDKTTDSYKDWVRMGDFVLPADYEDLYANALDIWNYGYENVKKAVDQIGIMYEQFSTFFQHSLHKTKEQIKSFSSLEDPYKTVYEKSFDVYKIKFFDTGDSNGGYYTINELMDAVNNLNVSYFSAMYRNDELENLSDLYIKMAGMAIDDTHGTIETIEEDGKKKDVLVLNDEFKQAAHDFFKAFVEAPASLQYNFLMTYSNEDKSMLQFIGELDNNSIIGNVIAIYFYNEVMKDISEEKAEEDTVIPSDKELAIDVFNNYLKALEAFDRREIGGKALAFTDFIAGRKAASDLLKQTPQSVKDLFATNELLKALIDKVDEYYALTENDKLKEFNAPSTYETEYASLTNAMSAAAIVLTWADANRAYGAFFAAYERVAEIYNDLAEKAVSDDALYNALNYGTVEITAVGGKRTVVPAIYMADLYGEFIGLMCSNSFYVDYNGEVVDCFKAYFDDPKIRDYVLESADFIVDYVLLIEVSADSSKNIHFVTTKNLTEKIEAFMAKFYGTASDAMTEDERVLFLSFYYDNNAFERALFFYYAEVFNLDDAQIGTAEARAAHPVTKYLRLMASYYSYKYWSEQDVAEDEIKGFKDAYEKALTEFNTAYANWSDVTAKAQFDIALSDLVEDFISLAPAAQA